LWRLEVVPVSGQAAVGEDALPNPLSPNFGRGGRMPIVTLGMGGKDGERGILWGTW